MTQRAFIVAAARTPVVPTGGAYRDLDYDRLAIAPIRSCLAQAGIEPHRVDEVVLSNALGAGGNPARVTALAAGLDQRVAGLSLDRQCAGGLDALLVARALIGSGQAEVVLAGGSESGSLRPQRGFRTRYGDEPVFRDQARFSPWPDRDPDMAAAADRLANELAISKAEQDDWAIASHTKALAATPVVSKELVNPDGHDLATDPFTRRMDKRLCERARPLAGSVTIANTAPAADAAALVLVVSEDVRRKLGVDHAMEIIAGYTTGADPERPGLAPVEAIARTVKSANRPLGAMRVELMEAYAVQAIACARATGMRDDQVNMYGGALARGHAIGASGAVLAVRLFSDLKDSPGTGLAAIAAAGGIGTAICLENG